MTELGLRSIPGYTVHELLETDLVSVTYLAERQSDGYPVVLQVMSDEFDDSESAEAFADALDRMAKIQHPVLPTVWDIGRASGVLFSVTSAVEGRSLASTLAGAARLDPADTLAICSELADTLDILHAADVVHGAINPHTVWINDRSRAPSAPRVTLRGFGTTPLLSRRVSAERPDPPPPDLYYVAPEQIRRDEISGRVDQYALACMAVHCLTGAPPFERSTVNALLGAHLFAAPRPSSEQWGMLPPHVIDAVQRALAKDPADRFPLCSSFATAIGGDRQRSWSWMIEEALGLRDGTGDAPPSPDTTIWLDDAEPAPGGEPAPGAKVPVGDDTAPFNLLTGAIAAAPGASDEPEEVPSPLTGPRARSGEATPTPAHPRPDPSTPSGPLTRRAADHEVTMRSLSEADWLPGNSGEPGATDRVAAPRRLPPVSPTDADKRRVDPQVLRWLAVAVATLFMVATIVVLALRTSDEDPAQPAAAGQQRAQRTPAAPEVTQAWQHSVTDGTVTTMLVTSGAVINGAGTTVTVLRPTSGDPSWNAQLAEQVMEVAALDGVVVARTSAGLHAFDERTGRELWDTTGDPVAPTAMAAGDTAVYEVATGDEVVRVRALAPATGEVQWVLDDLQVSGAGTWAVYDRSRHGDRMLYVLAGSRLHAVDTSEQDTRWETTLDGAEPASLTAIAGAILVIDSRGQICRYGMRDGDRVWTRCATLESGPGASAAVRTRNARVIVRSTNEVAAVDFTSGTSHWHVTDAGGFQAPFAANAELAFVTHADGGIEAIDHQRGVERWRSGPLGEVTAMTADDEAVYVATAAGDVTRMQATAPAGS
jgi:outer membrane protein assembly factor BamB